MYTSRIRFTFILLPGQSWRSKDRMGRKSLGVQVRTSTEPPFPEVLSERREFLERGGFFPLGGAGRAAGIGAGGSPPTG